MPTFDTPAPISVSVDIGAGSTEIIASERTDTIVEVRPSNSANKNDVAAADQTQVSYSDGNLTVKSPRNWRPRLAPTPSRVWKTASPTTSPLARRTKSGPGPSRVRLATRSRRLLRLQNSR